MGTIYSIEGIRLTFDNSEEKGPYDENVYDVDSEERNQRHWVPNYVNFEDVSIFCT